MNPKRNRPTGSNTTIKSRSYINSCMIVIWEFWDFFGHTFISIFLIKDISKVTFRCRMFTVTEYCCSFVLLLVHPVKDLNAASTLLFKMAPRIVLSVLHEMILR